MELPFSEELPVNTLIPLPASARRLQRHEAPESVIRSPNVAAHVVFVMISQNRADQKRQVPADHQWTIVQEEDEQNRELLVLSRQILELTKQVHAIASALPNTTAPRDADPSS